MRRKAKSDAIAVAHLGVLRAAYTLATGWDMATPMPPDLDVSKVLILSLARDGAPSLDALNVAAQAQNGLTLRNFFQRFSAWAAMRGRRARYQPATRPAA